MARDLRLLMAAMKIATDLERVGDHAVNIAQSAERLLGARLIAPEPELFEMARQAPACCREPSTHSCAVTRRWDGKLPA